jgi:alkanesulfonate monooxygenase SsuD/methylene tetrahydromethanopterin reductase-like flavin-dependent oxidoreductase (luciferase family)
MRVMGMNPVKPKAFADYLRVVRGLLHGEEVEYTLGGDTRSIRFLHEGMGFVNTEQPVDIYVAANGPLALAAAGAYGDGRISAGGEPEAVFKANLDRAAQGAAAIGREMPEPYHTAALTFSCVLEPGESLKSDRVVDQVGSMVTASLHFWWEIAQLSGSDDFIRPEIRDVWDQYLSYVETMQVPVETRFQQIHNGHCTFMMEEERRFVTPEMIRASGGLVGEPDEIIEMLREQERMGLAEVTLLPPMACARECFADFATHVIERY